MLRALETNEPLDRYLHLKAEVKRLTEAMKALEPEILCALLDEDGETAERHGCELRVMRRKTYAYSAQCERMASDLKALRKYEESVGIATIQKHICYVQVKALPTPRPAGYRCRECGEDLTADEAETFMGRCSPCAHAEAMMNAAI